MAKKKMKKKSAKKAATKKMAKKPAKKAMKAKAAPKKTAKKAKKTGKSAPKATKKRVLSTIKKPRTAAKSAMAPVVTMPTEGTSAPEFTTVTDRGETVNLQQFHGKWLVLYFYPKDQTPGCTIEACDFRDHMDALKSAGAEILGVSKDSVESHQKFVTNQNLNFPLSADVDGQVCEAYGTWQEKNLYGKKSMGIVRSTFLINPEGKIAKVFPKVKVEGHVAEILKVLQSQ